MEQSEKEKEFHQMLDQKIKPLVLKAQELNNKQNVLQTKEAKDEEWYQLMCVAIMEGMKLSQKLYDIVEPTKEDDKEKSEIERNMDKARKAKEYAARLSLGKDGMMPDGTPRFATPDQFDPVTGDYKGSKS